MQFTFKNKKINIENFENDDDFLMKLIEQLPTELKVVEIGAHHGKFAKPILEKFENALIIEGEDLNFQRLSNNLSMYKNKIQKHVVYKNSANHNWFVAEGSGVNALRLPLPNSHTVKSEKMKKMKVKTISLAEINFNFDFIKIDCEGADFPILQGATDLISKNRPLIYFEHSGQHGANAHKYTCDDFFSFFEKQNYVLHLANGKRFEKHMWNTDTEKKENSCNILAIPNGTA